MRGTTHLVGGLLAGAMVGAGLRGLPDLAGFGAAGLAALIPDWIQVNLPGGNRLVHGVFGHRGLSHWLITAGLVWWIVRWFAPDLALYALAGWVSHIALDVISGGAPALWPLPWRIELAHIKSGGALDMILGSASLLLTVVLVIWQWIQHL